MVISILFVALFVFLFWKVSPLIVSISPLLFLLVFVSIVLVLLGFPLWIAGGKNIDQYTEKVVLATQGYYGLTRNPIYSGILFTFTGSFFLITNSYLSIFLFIALYVSLLTLLPLEERILLQTFGKQYVNYKKNVNAIIPKLSSFETAFFYPLESGWISEHLLAIKDQNVNVFVYKDKDNYICFDAGYKDGFSLEELFRMNILPTDITHLFLTHSDHDHIGNVDAFSNAKCYIGTHEQELIYRNRPRLLGCIYNEYLGNNFTFLSNLESVRIGSTLIQALYTPGHTPGHTSYLLNNSILFSGDAIILQNGSILPFYRFFNWNQKQSVSSCNYIKSLSISSIFTAHTGCISFNTNKQK